jgi:hypothetical protein
MPLVLERKVNESVMIWDESDPNQILVVTSGWILSNGF